MRDLRIFGTIICIIVLSVFCAMFVVAVTDADSIQERIQAIYAAKECETSPLFHFEGKTYQCEPS